MRKILISGGPVHAHIDSVKIVTNRFRGGLMAKLASELAMHFPCEVTYLTGKGAVQPHPLDNVKVVHHEGFFDYLEKVQALSVTHSDVILGAAVANLVPVSPWKDKFPSHDYQEGDIVPIDFMVAPRVITKVKAVAPQTNLFGFKLLSNVPYQTLVDAAYGVLLDSHAAAVIANDTKDLNLKYIVTREKAVHAFNTAASVEAEAFHAFLWAMMNDAYYRTEKVTLAAPAAEGAALLRRAQALAAQEPTLFPQTNEGLMFGTIAQRSAASGFWTTGRGKKELDVAAWVAGVDHAQRVVEANEKAALNAPLLASLFERFPALTEIVHGHVQDPALPVLPYAPSGTARDSLREVTGSFNVAGHGCYRLYAGNTLIRS